MTLLLKVGAMTAVAAFGWLTVLYLDARAEYRDGLRRAFGFPTSESIAAIEGSMPHEY